jgi:hypothetical protein
MSFFLKIIYLIYFTLKRGVGRGFLYLLFFLLMFYYLYSFVIFFTS